MIHPQDPDDEWQTATNSGRAVRVRLLTGALVVLVVLAGGFWGGVVAEKHHGTGSTATSSLASRFAAAARAAGGTGGASTGGFAGLGGLGAGGATAGTVIDVQGNVVDISDSSGNIVKVTVGPSTVVTRTAASSPAGLKVGDTVVVTGSPTAPTAVRATAQGVRSGGGFSPTGG
jgi:hypothetical protein